MKTIEEWYDTLVELMKNTDFDVIIKTNINKPVVAIVPRGFSTPQRIAVYPKKTKNAGLVVEKDISMMPAIQKKIGEGREHNRRLHYYDISDQTILEACKIFLGKL